MFKPVRMERILVGGHRSRMEDVIETLHDQGVVHLEDFTDGSGITGMGSPLDAGDEASHQLLRVRGLQKAIGAEDTAAKTIPTPDEVAPLVDDAEDAITPLVNKELELRQQMSDLQGQLDSLRPFRGLDADLEALSGLTSVHVLTGFVSEDPTERLQQAGVDAEVAVHKGPAGLLAVVVVRHDAATDAERALAGAGFRAVQAPNGTGTPDAFAARLEQELADLAVDLEHQGERLHNLQNAWAGRLAALERLLEEEVARTQIPLRFAVTENTFHVEGWVPCDDVNTLENHLTHAFGDALYVERLGDAPRTDATAEHGEAGHDHDDHHEVAVEDEAPTKLHNPGPAGKYEFLLSLLAMPRYRELDPTKLIAIFFPIYFGLMVGDAIIGLLIVGFALWLRNNKLFGMGGEGVAKPMMWGGIWSVVIGLLVFGEGLGMHFVISEHAAENGEYSWETAFGFHFPDEGFLHVEGREGGHGTDHGAEDTHGGEGGMTNDESAAASLHAETSTESKSIFTPHEAPHLKAGPVSLGIYSKIHDIQALLVWSVLIGVVHLALGFMLGVRNVYVGHGLKLAIQEKVSWLMIMVSLPVAIVGNMQHSAVMTYGGLAVFLIAVILLWQGVQATLGAGFIAILEIPGLMGNLLSYTRLAAIGASKAGMAVAFAIIGFQVIGGIAGLLFYFVMIIVITLLAILAGFLQSLRLQFVEFFGKFYEGGGRPYVPFGRRGAQPPSSP